MGSAVATSAGAPDPDPADILARGKKPGVAVLPDGSCTCRFQFSGLVGPACSLHFDLYLALAQAERAGGDAARARREALESMVRQFAYTGTKDGAPCYYTGGLSALEDAFEVLGWDDPQPCPENKCQREGCPAYADCGQPTANGGYERVCGKHLDMPGRGPRPEEAEPCA